MKVCILGAAAGGGFPQWNCNCSNCHRLRKGRFNGKARTQDSLAISVDGRSWVLINASPDIREQLFRCPDLWPAEGTRGSVISAILLSDAELDHIAGLLSLREKQPLRIYSTSAIFHWIFEDNSAFRHLLAPSTLVWSELLSEPQRVYSASGVDSRLECQTMVSSDKQPFYAETPVESGAGAVVAYRIIDTRTSTSLLYVPVLRQLNEQLIAAASESDCLILDGTFWTANEMSTTRTGTASAYDMGHLPISGGRGSIELLRGLRIPRKIYTHINNTNPILDESSVEHSSLRQAGWEVAEDGMLFEV